MARTLDQMLATEKPEVVAKAQKAATEMLLNIHLAELRDRMNLTGEIAASLGVRQPTVSEMEKLDEISSCRPLSGTLRPPVASYASMLNFRTAPTTALPFNSIRPVMGRITYLALPPAVCGISLLHVPCHRRSA